VVQVESGLYYAADKHGEGYGMGPSHILPKRNWLRTVQSSFGWDWSERLLNVGIRGGACLEICSGVRFDSLSVVAEVAEDLRSAKIRARVFAEPLDGKAHKGQLTVRVHETGQEIRVPVEIAPGLAAVSAEVVVDAPKLWWPVGHGDQPRYTVTATLEADGAVAGQGTRKIGLRHVRVNQSAHATKGRHFIIEVNHKPIFVKGGNYVPADPIIARIDRRRYETLIDRALESNFNMLRVWGGGLYESDDFYELCDEKGILVWQEFIFACTKYPGTDEAFLADVKREAAYQVRRLAHHPSLVVWCGNNENEWGNWEWNFQKGVAHPDYAIFHMVLPRIVNDEDGTRYYQPSSPFSPNHEIPNADHVGDQHPWSIGFFDTDFRKYRLMDCRFPNEGGFLGATSLPTVRSCLPRGEDRPGSFHWEMHDNSIAYWTETCNPDRQLVQWLGKDIGSMSIEDYVYWAGLLQGEALSEYIRNFRRRMFSTASAIFWMYNDCWPMVRSWTTVDYYLRRTPSFHPVRRAMSPLAVVTAHEGGKIKIFGVNEGPAWKGELRYGIFALAGGLPKDVAVKAALPANASTLLAEFDEAELTAAGDTRHGAFAILSDRGATVAQDRLLLPLFKDIAWPAASVSVRRQGTQAVFESPTFAWRVCLDLDGEKRLADNFFDVLPGIATVIDWPDELGEPKVLRVGNLG